MNAIEQQNILLEKLITEQQKKKTAHWLHLILSILTCGAWLPVWFLVNLSNKAENEKYGKTKVLAAVAIIGATIYMCAHYL